MILITLIVILCIFNIVAFGQLLLGKRTDKVADEFDRVERFMEEEEFNRESRKLQ